MVNTSADNVDTMVHNQPIVLREQCHEMREHTPLPKPPALAAQRTTLAPRPRPKTLQAHPLSGWVDVGLVTLQNSRPALPSL
jgi:hypothetical protein